jgi:hypothetical protein
VGERERKKTNDERKCETRKQKGVCYVRVLGGASSESSKRKKERNIVKPKQIISCPKSNGCVKAHKGVEGVNIVVLPLGMSR